MPSIDDVYRKFGEAAEAAQLLETELGTTLLVIRAEEIDAFLGNRGEEATEILRGINRTTLGQLMNTLSNLDPAYNALGQSFAAALAARNRLMHSFYRRHGIAMFSEDGRERMLQDLDSIHATLLAAYKLALMLAGIDIDAIVRRAGSFEREGGK